MEISPRFSRYALALSEAREIDLLLVVKMRINRFSVFCGKRRGRCVDARSEFFVEHIETVAVVADFL